MKNGQVLILEEGLRQLFQQEDIACDTAEDRKVFYACRRTADIIAPIAKIIRETADSPLDAYEKERLALCEEYADRRDNNALKFAGKFQIIERRAEFDKKIEELQDKFKKEIEERDKYLESDVAEEVKIHKIKLDQLPIKLSGSKHMKYLFFLIEE